jgi:hypothetical protein
MDNVQNYDSYLMYLLKRAWCGIVCRKMLWRQLELVISLSLSELVSNISRT